MLKPKGFDAAERQGDYLKLPAGGYICQIVSVQETTSQSTGKPMIKIALDIADGSQYQNYYRNIFNKRKKDNPDAKWPCISNVVTINDEGFTSGAFKNFIECVRESNGGWEPSWDDNFCNKLKAARVGVVFGEEEYEDREGKIRTSVKPGYGHFKNIQEIKEGAFNIPEKKTLDKPNKGYQATPGGGSSLDDEIPEGFTTIDESEIPF